MHLPIFIDPEQHSRPLCVPYVTLLALFSVSLVQLWQPREPLPHGCYLRYPVAVPMVTVKRVSPVMYHPGGLTYKTEIVPLIELYYELCELEDTYQNEDEFLQAEQDFAFKYGLSLERIASIKREGYRLQKQYDHESAGGE